MRINEDTIIDLFPVKGSSVAQKSEEKKEGNLNHFCFVVEKEDFSGLIDY